jgi:hypothetical protein
VRFPLLMARHVSERMARGTEEMQEAGVTENLLRNSFDSGPF